MNTKFILPFLLLFACLQNGQAQVVAKNSTVLEAYYGYPDLWSILFRSVTGSGGIHTINTTGQGPVGLRLDHIFTKRIGFGVDVWYVNTRITGTYNPTRTVTSSNISFNANLNRINALARLTIHLSEHEKFDPYIHLGLGYLYSRYSFSSTNRSVFDVQNPLPPVSGRIGFGAKYYFNPEFGIVMDVGLGGPLISLGVFKRWLHEKDNQ